MDSKNILVLFGSFWSLWISKYFDFVGKQYTNTLNFCNRIYLYNSRFDITSNRIRIVFVSRALGITGWSLTVAHAKLKLANNKLFRISFIVNCKCHHFERIVRSWSHLQSFNNNIYPMMELKINVQIFKIIIIVLKVTTKVGKYWINFEKYSQSDCEPENLIECSFE